MRKLSRFFLAGLALVFALSIVGCSSGTAGDEGGAPAQVSAVEVSDNGSTATMTVNFALSDSGSPLAGVAASDIQFTVAKLIPPSSPSYWQSYINTTETKAADDPGTTPDGTTATHTTSERCDKAGGVFKDNGDGTYSYQFSFNFRAVTTPVPVTYDPSLTHRIGMQVTGNASNATYDFVPNSPNATPATRSIVDNASCSECHKKFGFHGGDRVSVKYCVTCHNPGNTDANSGNTLDFTVMVHKIHRNYLGADAEWITTGGVYTIWGFDNREHPYSEEVIYPQDIRNCLKCHNGADAATPDGDNWKNMPSLAACTTCHAAPDPVKYPNFPNLTPTEIEIHMSTSNLTPNNPYLPPGVPNIQYVLNSATVNATNQAVINFQILRDGQPLELKPTVSADLRPGTSRPAFILGYAQTQDGINNPAEYNNFGKSAAQPQTVTLSDAFTNSVNLVKNGDGTFTATMPIANAFPVGSTLRAVGLQGYYQINVNGVTYSLHTPSAVVAVTGDASRREVVDNNGCAKCHEWFEGHGGSRVFNINICVFCHNPNLSSSGRAVIDPKSPEVVAAYGNNPLEYPEATNNLKDMIHGIHGVEKRTTDYEFVRNRNAGTGNGIPYNWGHVKFPGRAGDCLTCHKPGTYEVPLNDSALLTTNRTTGVDSGLDANTAAVTAARNTVPNATDFVITPTAAACFACHDSEVAKTHMIQNGAAINNNRTDPEVVNSFETCSLCHAPGRSADIAVVHAAPEFTLTGVIQAPAQEGDSGGGQTQVDLCGPGPVTSQPPGHTDRPDCCSCHSPR